MKHFHADVFFSDNDSEHTIEDFMNLIIKCVENKGIKVHSAHYELKDNVEIDDIKWGFRRINDKK